MNARGELEVFMLRLKEQLSEAVHRVLIQIHISVLKAGISHAGRYFLPV